MNEKTMVLMMAIGPHTSECTKKLALRILDLMGEDEAGISECGIAAMYVMAAYIALIEKDETRAIVIDGMSEKVGAIVEANRKAMAAHAAAN
jgi:hypothetical protein